MTAVAGGARHDPRILTAGMQGRRGCLEAFRGPCRPSGVLATAAHPATNPGHLDRRCEIYGNSLIQYLLYYRSTLAGWGTVRGRGWASSECFHNKCIPLCRGFI